MCSATNPVVNYRYLDVKHLPTNMWSWGSFGVPLSIVTKPGGPRPENPWESLGVAVMLRISKKLMFAIEAVLDIAYNAGTEPVQSGEITRRQGIPKRYLEQVLQQLVREGVLAGVRGPRGGYRLARERRRITLGEIVKVVRSMETATDPIEEPAGSILGHKVVRPLWGELQEETMKQLDTITIEDLCMRARSAGVESETEDRIDFTI